MPRKTDLTVKQILVWADAYHMRTGRWPERTSGKVWEPSDEKWANIDQALYKGLRGLHKGQSLARVLAKHRGKRNRKQLPKYSIGGILKWADNFHVRRGRWPRLHDGEVGGAPGETWAAVDEALRSGIRSLNGGSSLAQLLARKRRVPNPAARPRLTQAQVLRWCDAHFRRTGTWPKATGDVIPHSDGDTWQAIDLALRNGRRGLRRSSLYRLLAKHRKVDRIQLSRFTIRQILAWCDEYHERTEMWPNSASGRIAGTRRESWLGVHLALTLGKRGLPGGMSIGKLLTAARGVRYRTNLPVLTEEKILLWARRYKRKHHRWPDQHSGPIPHSGGETWTAVRLALQRGGRGLKRRTTLTQLLARRD